MDSILLSVAKAIGVTDAYFNEDLIMCINTVFSVLLQLGVGPAKGFSISDDRATWSDFSDNPIMNNMVQTYVKLKVQSLFDPSANSNISGALDRQASELEWRLMNYSKEGEA